MHSLQYNIARFIKRILLAEYIVHNEYYRLGDTKSVDNDHDHYLIPFTVCID